MGYNRLKWAANYDTVFAKKPKKARNPAPMTNNAEDLNLLGEDTFQPAIGLAPISDGAWLGVSFGGG